MPDADFESGLVDGLVKTRKGFSGMSRRKLRNTKKPGKAANKKNKVINNCAHHLIHGCIKQGIA